MNRPAVLAFALLSAAFSAGPALAAPAAAPAGGDPQDVKALIELNKKCMRELSAHASKVTFGRKDVEKYLAEWQSFDALDEDEASDEDDELCVDLGKALADPKYVAWARERRLDLKGWLLTSLRISLTHLKRRAPAEAAELKAQMDAQRRDLSKRCKSMGPTACRDMEKGFAAADELIRETAAMMALFPEPTRAEAALLAEYEARLQEVAEGPSGGGDEEGDPDDGDGPAEEDQVE